METHESIYADIVSEILTYLPPKPLMQFKCVCKAWNTLLQHPNFVRSHYVRSQTRPSATRLLFQLQTYPKKQYYDRYISESEGLLLQLYYFCCDGEMTICSNHCNGLVCLYSYKDAQVYLYNVTTRKIKALPPSVNLEIKIKRYKHPFNPKLLLGFDQVTGNYKLLLLFPHQGAKEAKILTLGVTNSSWRKIDLLNYTDNSYLFSKECIFLNGVIYLIWFTYVAYFNFGEEKFGYISPPPQASFKRPSIMQTAFWGKLAMYCHYIAGPGGLGLFGYDDANKILIPLEMTRPMFIDVAVALLGAERINDKTKEAHVLATTSVISAPASLLSSSSRPCCITFVSSFVEHNNNNTRPRIVLRFASSFVENIISLKSLLV